MSKALSNESGFLARGGCAVLVLIVLTGAYILDLIGAAITGRNVPVSEHRGFWATILISAILTAVAAGARATERSKPSKASIRRESTKIPTPTEERDTKKCPYCAELVKVEAIKCKHCGSSLTIPKTDSPQAEDPVSDLIFQLKSQDADVRELAAERLGEMGYLAASALSDLEIATKDKAYRVRTRAQWAKERIEHARAAYNKSRLHERKN